MGFREERLSILLNVVNTQVRKKNLSQDYSMLILILLSRIALWALFPNSPVRIKQFCQAFRYYCAGRLLNFELFASLFHSSLCLFLWMLAKELLFPTALSQLTSFFPTQHLEMRIARGWWRYVPRSLPPVTSVTIWALFIPIWEFYRSAWLIWQPCIGLFIPDKWN